MSKKTKKGVPYVRQRVGAGNQTGRVGVTPLTLRCKRSGGAVVTRRYFVAELMTDGRPRRRQFCIDTLGRDLAYREAVRCRERWEREVALARQAAEPARIEDTKQYLKAWRAKQPAGFHRNYMQGYKADPQRLAAWKARQANYGQQPQVLKRRLQRRAARVGYSVISGICDGCQKERKVLRVRTGEQWANCLGCFKASAQFSNRAESPCPSK